MKYGVTRRPASLMESFFGDDLMDAFSYGTDLDIYKEGNDYVVEYDIPGFDKDDIHIEYKGDILSIRASHKEENEDTDSDRNYYYRSRSYQNVHRQIRFPDVDQNQISAQYRNGVLKVVLPTKHEDDISNRIEIE